LPKYKKLEDFIKSEEKKEEFPSSLPCIPLKGEEVAFPTALTPFYVGRDMAIKALEEVVETEERYLILVSQKDPEVEHPTARDVYRVGTLARLLQIAKLPDGGFKAIAEGIARVKIKRIVKRKPHFVCEFEIWEKKIRKTKSVLALMRLVKQTAKKYFEMTNRLPKEALKEMDLFDEPDKLVDTIASFIPAELEKKQHFLEMKDPKKRMIELLKHLNSEIELLELEGKIEKEVKNRIDKTQKEYYLREKLETIKDELGIKTDEAYELRNRLKEKKYPAEVKETVLKEIERLEKMHPSSAEASVSRTYIEWLLELPWIEKTEESFDIKRAETILNSDHYGLEDVKERILDYIAVKKFSGTAKSPILCLVGPPGVGKTSLGMSLAKALNRKFGQISLGGMRDEAEIRGHRRTYVGALPGRIIQTLKKLKTNNPLILLDEIDKMGISFQGDPAAALLEVLDPEQNSHFVDYYVEIPFDLSDVVFVTTANTVDPIPPALLDRMEVIEIPGYTLNEKVEIAKRHLIPKLKAEYGLKNFDFSITKRALEKLIEEYTLESGVRNLERILAKLLRKVARKLVEGEKNVKIKMSNLEEFLGAPVLVKPQLPFSPRVGETVGLAWTRVGGAVLTVESLIVPGSSKMILTGNLGDVMKESATIAMTLCKKMCGDSKKEFFEKHDFHIHVPEGAVPKDGPSAGVTMFSSLCSSVTNKAARNDVAMTGEITLNGDVLAIGGLREKILAAKRMGIMEVIVPKANEPMVRKMKKDVVEGVKIHYVSNVEEVLRLVLGEKDVCKKS
jgi:ATP-dependent Lon protease